MAESADFAVQFGSNAAAWAKGLNSELRPAWEAMVHFNEQLEALKTKTANDVSQINRAAGGLKVPAGGGPGGGDSPAMDRAMRIMSERVLTMGVELGAFSESLRTITQDMAVALALVKSGPKVVDQARRNQLRSDNARTQGQENGRFAHVSDDVKADRAKERSHRAAQRHFEQRLAKAMGDAESSTIAASVDAQEAANATSSAAAENLIAAKASKKAAKAEQKAAAARLATAKAQTELAEEQARQAAAAGGSRIGAGADSAAAGMGGTVITADISDTSFSRVVAAVDRGTKATEGVRKSVVSGFETLGKIVSGLKSADGAPAASGSGTAASKAARTRAADEERAAQSEANKLQRQIELRRRQQALQQLQTSLGARDVTDEDRAFEDVARIRSNKRKALQRDAMQRALQQLDAGRDVSPDLAREAYSKKDAQKRIIGTGEAGRAAARRALNKTLSNPAMVALPEYAALEAQEAAAVERTRTPDGKRPQGWVRPPGRVVSVDPALARAAAGGSAATEAAFLAGDDRARKRVEDALRSVDLGIRDRDRTIADLQARLDTLGVAPGGGKTRRSGRVTAKGRAATPSMSAAAAAADSAGTRDLAEIDSEIAKIEARMGALSAGDPKRDGLARTKAQLIDIRKQMEKGVSRDDAVAATLAAQSAALNQLAGQLASPQGATTVAPGAGKNGPVVSSASRTVDTSMSTANLAAAKSEVDKQSALITELTTQAQAMKGKPGVTAVRDQLAGAIVARAQAERQVKALTPSDPAGQFKQWMADLALLEDEITTLTPKRKASAENTARFGEITSQAHEMVGNLTQLLQANPELMGTRPVPEGMSPVLDLAYRRVEGLRTKSRALARLGALRKLQGSYQAGRGVDAATYEAASAGSPRFQAKVNASDMAGSLPHIDQTIQATLALLTNDGTLPTEASLAGDIATAEADLTALGGYAKGRPIHHGGKRGTLVKEMVSKYKLKSGKPGDAEDEELSAAERRMAREKRRKEERDKLLASREAAIRTFTQHVANLDSAIQSASDEEKAGLVESRDYWQKRLGSVQRKVARMARTTRDQDPAQVLTAQERIDTMRDLSLPGSPLWRDVAGATAGGGAAVQGAERLTEKDLRRIAATFRAEGYDPGVRARDAKADMVAKIDQAWQSYQAAGGVTAHNLGVSERTAARVAPTVTPREVERLLNSPAIRGLTKAMAATPEDLFVQGLIDRDVAAGARGTFPLADEDLAGLQAAWAKQFAHTSRTGEVVVPEFTQAGDRTRAAYEWARQRGQQKTAVAIPAASAFLDQNPTFNPWGDEGKALMASIQGTGKEQRQKRATVSRLYGAIHAWDMQGYADDKAIVDSAAKLAEQIKEAKAARDAAHAAIPGGGPESLDTWMAAEQKVTDLEAAMPKASILRAAQGTVARRQSWEDEQLAAWKRVNQISGRQVMGSGYMQALFGKTIPLGAGHGTGFKTQLLPGVRFYDDKPIEPAEEFMPPAASKEREVFYKRFKAFKRAVGSAKRAAGDLADAADQVLKLQAELDAAMQSGATAEHRMALTERINQAKALKDEAQAKFDARASRVFTAYENTYGGRLNTIDTVRDDGVTIRKYSLQQQQEAVRRDLADVRKRNEAHSKKMKARAEVGLNLKDPAELLRAQTQAGIASKALGEPDAVTGEAHPAPWNEVMEAVKLLVPGADLEALDAERKKHDRAFGAAALRPEVDQAHRRKFASEVKQLTGKVVPKDAYDDTNYLQAFGLNEGGMNWEAAFEQVARLNKLNDQQVASMRAAARQMGVLRGGLYQAGKTPLGDFAMNRMRHLVKGGLYNPHQVTSEGLTHHQDQTVKAAVAHFNKLEEEAALAAKTKPEIASKPLTPDQANAAFTKLLGGDMQEVAKAIPAQNLTAIRDDLRTRLVEARRKAAAAKSTAPNLALWGADKAAQEKLSDDDQFTIEEWSEAVGRLRAAQGVRRTLSPKVESRIRDQLAGTKNQMAAWQQKADTSQAEVDRIQAEYDAIGAKYPLKQQSRIRRQERDLVGNALAAARKDHEANLAELARVKNAVDRREQNLAEFLERRAKALEELEAAKKEVRALQPAMKGVRGRWGATSGKLVGEQKAAYEAARAKVAELETQLEYAQAGIRAHNPLGMTADVTPGGTHQLTEIAGWAGIAPAEFKREHIPQAIAGMGVRGIEGARDKLAQYGIQWGPTVNPTLMAAKNLTELSAEVGRLLKAGQLQMVAYTEPIKDAVAAQSGLRAVVESTLPSATRPSAEQMAKHKSTIDAARALAASGGEGLTPQKIVATNLKLAKALGQDYAQVTGAGFHGADATKEMLARASLLTAKVSEDVKAKVQEKPLKVLGTYDDVARATGGFRGKMADLDPIIARALAMVTSVQATTEFAGGQKVGAPGGPPLPLPPMQFGALVAKIAAASGQDYKAVKAEGLSGLSLLREVLARAGHLSDAHEPKPLEAEAPKGPMSVADGVNRIVSAINSMHDTLKQWPKGRRASLRESAESVAAPEAAAPAAAGAGGKPPTETPVAAAAADEPSRDKSGHLSKQRRDLITSVMSENPAIAGLLGPLSQQFVRAKNGQYQQGGKFVAGDAVIDAAADAGLKMRKAGLSLARATLAVQSALDLTEKQAREVRGRIEGLSATANIRRVPLKERLADELETMKATGAPSADVAAKTGELRVAQHTMRGTPDAYDQILAGMPADVRALLTGGGTAFPRGEDRRARAVAGQSDVDEAAYGLISRGGLRRQSTAFNMVSDAFSLTHEETESVKTRVRSRIEAEKVAQERGQAAAEADRKNRAAGDAAAARAVADNQAYDEAVRRQAQIAKDRVASLTKSLGSGRWGAYRPEGKVHGAFATEADIRAELQAAEEDATRAIGKHYAQASTRFASGDAQGRIDVLAIQDAQKAQLKDLMLGTDPVAAAKALAQYMSPKAALGMVGRQFNLSRDALAGVGMQTTSQLAVEELSAAQRAKVNQLHGRALGENAAFDRSRRAAGIAAGKADAEQVASVAFQESVARTRSAMSTGTTVELMALEGLIKAGGSNAVVAAQQAKVYALLAVDLEAAGRKAAAFKVLIGEIFKAIGAPSSAGVLGQIARNHATTQQRKVGDLEAAEAELARVQGGTASEIAAAQLAVRKAKHMQQGDPEVHKRVLAQAPRQLVRTYQGATTPEDAARSLISGGVRPETAYAMASDRFLLDRDEQREMKRTVRSAISGDASGERLREAGLADAAVQQNLATATGHASTATLREIVALKGMIDTQQSAVVIAGQAAKVYDMLGREMREADLSAQQFRAAIGTIFKAIGGPTGAALREIGRHAVMTGAAGTSGPAAAPPVWATPEAFNTFVSKMPAGVYDQLNSIVAKPKADGYLDFYSKMREFYGHNVSREFTARTYGVKAGTPEMLAMDEVNRSVVAKEKEARQTRQTAAASRHAAEAATVLAARIEAAREAFARFSATGQAAIMAHSALVNSGASEADRRASATALIGTLTEDPGMFGLTGGAVKKNVAAVMRDVEGDPKHGLARNTRLLSELTGAADQGQVRQMSYGMGESMALATQDGFGRTFGGGGFWARMMHSTGTFIIRNLSGYLVFGITNVLQDALMQGIETESTFVRVSQALEQTGRSAGDLRQRLAGLSTQYGVALKDVYTTAAGLTGLFDETDVGNKGLLALTEVATQLQLISGGALNATEAMRSLASVTSAYGEVDVFHIADVLTTVQTQLGVNLEDSVEGVARLSGMTKELGIDFEHAAVYVSAIAKFTNQTGGGAGEQFSRILASMQTGRTQNIVTKAFSTIGVDMAKPLAERDFQGAVDIMLANYAKLGDAEKSRVTVALGGQKQAAAVNGLLIEGAKVLNTVEAAYDSEGNAQERVAAITETLAAKLTRLRTAFTALLATLINSGLLDSFGVAMEGLIQVMEGLITVFSVFNRVIESNTATKWAWEAIVVLGGFYAATLLATKGWRALKATMATQSSMMTAAADRVSLASALRGEQVGRHAPPAPPGPKHAPAPPVPRYVAPDSTLGARSPVNLLNAKMAGWTNKGANLFDRWGQSVRAAADSVAAKAATNRLAGVSIQTAADAGRVPRINLLPQVPPTGLSRIPAGLSQAASWLKGAGSLDIGAAGSRALGSSLGLASKAMVGLGGAANRLSAGFAKMAQSSLVANVGMIAAMVALGMFVAGISKLNDIKNQYAEWFKDTYEPDKDKTGADANKKDANAARTQADKLREQSGGWSIALTTGLLGVWDSVTKGGRPWDNANRRTEANMGILPEELNKELDALRKQLFEEERAAKAWQPGQAKPAEVTAAAVAAAAAVTASKLPDFIAEGNSMLPDWMKIPEPAAPKPAAPSAGPVGPTPPSAGPAGPGGLFPVTRGMIANPMDIPWKRGMGPNAQAKLRLLDEQTVRTQDLADASIKKINAREDLSPQQKAQAISEVEAIRAAVVMQIGQARLVAQGLSATMMLAADQIQPLLSIMKSGISMGGKAGAATKKLREAFMEENGFKGNEWEKMIESLYSAQTVGGDTNTANMKRDVYKSYLLRAIKINETLIESTKEGSDARTEAVNQGMALAGELSSVMAEERTEKTALAQSALEDAKRKGAFGKAGRKAVLDAYELTVEAYKEGLVNESAMQAATRTKEQQLVELAKSQANKHVAAAKRKTRNANDLAEIELKAANAEYKALVEVGADWATLQASLDRIKAAEWATADLAASNASALANYKIAKMNPKFDSVERAKATYDAAVAAQKSAEQRFNGGKKYDPNDTSTDQRVIDAATNAVNQGWALIDAKLQRNQRIQSLLQAKDQAAIAKMRPGATTQRSEAALAAAKQNLAYLKDHRDDSPEAEISYQQGRAAYWQQFWANEQAFQSVAENQASLASAIATAAGDSVKAATANLAVAKLKLANAKARGEDPSVAKAAVISAQAAKRDALSQEATSLNNLAMAVASAAGDSARVARLKLTEATRLLKEAVAKGAGKKEVADATARQVEAEAAVRDAVSAEATSVSNLAGAIATAKGDVVGAAQLKLKEATRLLQSAIAKGSGAKEINDAKAQQVEAEAALRDAKMQYELDTVDFQQEMGQITGMEAVKALQAMLRATDLTEQQRRSIMLKIKGLQDGIRQQLTGSGFNIPTEIAMPTAYQVRRSLGVDKARESIAQSVTSSQARVIDVTSASGGMAATGTVSAGADVALIGAVTGVKDAVLAKGAQVVNQDVQITNQVPTAAIAKAIIKEVMSEMNRQARSAQRASGPTPRTVRS